MSRAYVAEYHAGSDPMRVAPYSDTLAPNETLEEAAQGIKSIFASRKAAQNN